MNIKKIIGTVFVSLFMICGIFAQTAKSIGLAGKWAKKTGTSDFFLNIDENYITYIDKKTEKVIDFSYKLLNGSEDAKNYPYRLQILNYFQDSESLEVQNIYEDFLRSLENGGIIPINLEKEVLTLSLLNKKYKMIPFSKKDEKVGFWKKVGTGAAEVAAGAIAVLVTADAIDDSIDNKDMQEIADACLEASLAAY